MIEDSTREERLVLKYKDLIDKYPELLELLLDLDATLLDEEEL